MRAVVALALLCACRSSPPATKVEAGVTAGAAQGWLVSPPTTQPSFVDRTQVLDAIKASPKRSVATVRERAEECSSMGGSHVLLLAGATKIHFGGHGVNLTQMLKLGEVYVVGWDARDAGASTENRKWCVPGWTIDGRATALLPVADEAEGTRVLADLGK